MPKSCAVVDCKSNSRKRDRKFFRFPMLQYQNPKSLAITQTRQEMWVRALNRADFPPSRFKHATVCDRHFVSGLNIADHWTIKREIACGVTAFLGRSAHYTDVDNVDWIPTLNLGETFEIKTEPIEQEGPSQKFFTYESFGTHNEQMNGEDSDDDVDPKPDYLEEVTWGMDPDNKNVSAEEWDSDSTDLSNERPQTNFVCVSVGTVSTQTDDAITGMSSDILRSYQRKVASLEAMLLGYRAIKVERC